MPDVKMNYDSMENMRKAFHNAHKQVDTSIKEMEKVAKTLEGGALLGDAGVEFVDAIRGKLIKRMTVVKEKLEELEQDIRGAVATTRDGVKNAKGHFNN